jgi:hypothetical protein
VVINAPRAQFNAAKEPSGKSYFHSPIRYMARNEIKFLCQPPAPLVVEHAQSKYCSLQILAQIAVVAKGFSNVILRRDRGGLLLINILAPLALALLDQESQMLAEYVRLPCHP